MAGMLPNEPSVLEVRRAPRARSTVPLLLMALALSACGSDRGDSGARTGEQAGSGAPGTAGGAAVIDTFPPLPSPTAETLPAYVEERARRLAAMPWMAPDTTLPPVLAGLDYDAYQRIRFRPERALWRDHPHFEVQFFPRGFLFPEEVRVHVVDADGEQTVPFDPADFDGGGVWPDGTGAVDAGFAGLRINTPLNRPGVKDEALVFLGSSYFRLLGTGHVHGLSGRGLAIDTSGEGPEEFPDFREFWLVRPAPGDSTLTIHALLDSPSLTGAYRFVLAPGDPTLLDVQALLFARRDIRVLGVAPLTSMFLHDGNAGREWDDVRPRVHDSDGLLMHTGRGEWIWRPLSNGPGLQVSSLRDRDPEGFGLVQRERDFGNFLDLEARYHDRPSIWVEPLGSWGEGGVELVEIPTPSEFNDNIVAYWAPGTRFRAGETRDYRYRLTTFGSRLPAQTLAQVVRTRIGWDALPGEAAPPPKSRRRFVIDFADGARTGAPTPPEPDLSTSSGVLHDVRVLPLPDGEGWRVTFALEPEGTNHADMRLFLVADETPVSETWSYLWIPDRVR
jgi:periplasmic glucans biosynthesis protein